VQGSGFKGEYRAGTFSWKRAGFGLQKDSIGTEEAGVTREKIGLKRLTLEPFTRF
jgi:hypothetical protein